MFEVELVICTVLGNKQGIQGYLSVANYQYKKSKVVFSFVAEFTTTRSGAHVNNSDFRVIDVDRAVVAYLDDTRNKRHSSLIDAIL